MAGKRAVDKVSKGLNALIDEFAGAVKEMVNAGFLRALRDRRLHECG